MSHLFFILLPNHVWTLDRAENGLGNISPVGIYGIYSNSVLMYVCSCVSCRCKVSSCQLLTHTFLSFITAHIILKFKAWKECILEQIPSSSRCRAVCPGMLKAKCFWKCSFVALEKRTDHYLRKLSRSCLWFLFCWKMCCISGYVTGNPRALFFTVWEIEGKS